MRVDLKAFLIFVFFIIGASVSSVLSSFSLFGSGILISSAVLVFGRRIGATLLFAFVLLGVFLLGSFYFNLRETFSSPASYDKSRAVITSFPERRESAQRFEVKTEEGGRVLISTRLYPSFRYGDMVVFSGDSARGTDGKDRVFFPDISLDSRGHGNKINSLLFSFREKLVGNLKYALPPSSSALAAGILFGDQSGFTPEMWESFRETGTTHIVALSGFNIGVIALCVSWLFCLISRKAGIIASGIAVTLFVIMAGAGASAVRAAIMGMIIVLGRGMGRGPSMRNIIAFAALVMVIADPGVVVFDIGFELSFAAVLGIIYLAPAIGQLFRWERGNELRDICVDTASAEIAVMPIILLRFGEMSWYSFFTNIAVVFTVPLAMGLGFIVAVIGDCLGPLSVSVAVLADIILQYELKTIDIFAGIF